ncbi:hypothetical protein GCM10023082_13280 [Streptomyces tremellae]|uniref:Uncharacterized protein n=1 Tax=Streptomyces tremellae TaxID=1124239 RepID=A0ABP7EDW0_9ACTN
MGSAGATIVLSSIANSMAMSRATIAAMICRGESRGGAALGASAVIGEPSVRLRLRDAVTTPAYLPVGK